MAHKVFLALAVLLASHSSQAKLHVVTDPSPVVVKAGEDAHLKCLLKTKQPVDLTDLVVQWFTRGTLAVEYDDKLTIDSSGMSMSIDALKTGDATLTITNATHEHSGNFRCYVYYDSNHIMKQTVLKVDDPNKPKKDDLHSVTSEELNKKLNKVLDWFLTFTGKLEELVSESKKCSAKP